MDLIGLLVLFVIAAIAGAIGQSLAGYSLGGCIVSAIVGFVGVWLGTQLAAMLGLPGFDDQHSGRALPGRLGDHRLVSVHAHRRRVMRRP
jgi:uncharacterized membrane protein YeaQ/YmgE (transglycosylase-associated protein family)